MKSVKKILNNLDKEITNQHKKYNRIDKKLHKLWKKELKLNFRQDFIEATIDALHQAQNLYRGDKK